MSGQAHGAAFETLAIHAGASAGLPEAAGLDVDPTTLGLAWSLSSHAGAITVLEERMAILEGGTAAVAVASGEAARLLVLQTLLEPGDDIIVCRRIAGTSREQFTQGFKSFNWNVKWADTERPESFIEVLTDRTKAIFIESIASSVGLVADIRAVATVARRARLPLVVDNTLATPYLVRPFEHGADIVLHMASTFLGVGGLAKGGLIVDGGTFDWMAGDRYPLLTRPQSVGAGTAIGETFGNFAFAVACREIGLRYLGLALALPDAIQIVAGLETLGLRMHRHCDNATAVARALKADPRVAWVRYSGLEDDPSHAAVQLHGARGAGSTLTFGLVGGRDVVAALLKRLKLVSTRGCVGMARSQVRHPASDSGIAGQDPIAGAAAADVVWASIGLEDPTDIIADFDQALAGRT